MDHFLDTNGIRLHYLDHGSAGEPLVLLPGLTANAHAFDGLAAAGLAQHFRLLALDLRGRGLSDKPAPGPDGASYRMADHAADVLGLLDTLGLARVSLVGHSFGGLLGMYMAARHPERVARLVIIDAAIAAASPRTREQIGPSLARLGQVYPSLEAYLALIRQAPYFAGWDWDPAVESYFRADVQPNPDGTVQPRARPEHIATVMEGTIAEDWPTLVRTIGQPVLLLNATGPYGPPGAPPIVSVEQARETLALLSNYQYVEVTGNHMTMLYGEGARQIVSAIAGFLSIAGSP